MTPTIYITVPVEQELPKEEERVFSISEVGKTIKCVRQFKDWRVTHWLKPVTSLKELCQSPEFKAELEKVVSEAFDDAIIVCGKDVRMYNESKSEYLQKVIQ